MAEGDLERRAAAHAVPATVAWRHIRRHQALYVAGVVLALVGTLVPTLEPQHRTALDDFGPVLADDAPADAATGSSSSAATIDGETASRSSNRTPDGRGRTPSPAALAGEEIRQLAAAGRSRGGVTCTPNAFQVDFSVYAPPCRVAFTASNGGSTSRGVSADRIVLVDRVLNFPEVDHLRQQAGIDRDAFREVRSVFLEHFNRTFELHGRRVELVEFQADAGYANELSGGNRDGACADAAEIADEIGAFGVLFGTDPFVECAVERRLLVFGALGPESLRRRNHPYMWDVVSDCESFTHRVVEYLGKRLHGRPAIWAGDPEYRSRLRKIGYYVPDNDSIKPCIEIGERIARERYGIEPVGITYSFDLARLAEQAHRAVIRFKDAGVTSLLLVGDDVSTIFLAQSATSQGWHPEWIIAQGIDDGVTRLYDQDQMDGHMFGHSLIPPNRILHGPGSEPARLYKRLTGRELPTGARTGAYYQLMFIFSLFQAAGPRLTPHTLGDGAYTLPPRSGPEIGPVSLHENPDGSPGRSHAWFRGGVEVYWDGQGTGFDGEQGTHHCALDCRWFRAGQWPRGEPAVYPDRG